MHLEYQRYTGPQDRENRQSAVLLTKAGPVTIFSNPYRQVHACIVPHSIHIHSKTITFDDILATQPQIQIIPTMESLRDKKSPIVSIVKGMSFSLVDLTDGPEMMAALRAGQAPAAVLDEEWNVGLAGCLYYQRTGVDRQEGEPVIHKIHQRMIVDGLEDPGTGSASCALSCYLALTMTDNGDTKSHGVHRTTEKEHPSDDDAGIVEGTKSLQLETKTEHYVFGIEQGVEMGRKCQICVEVDITESAEGKREVSAVMLSGRCKFTTRGEIVGIY
jgi:predicted PhzF superfamily epimerase YddE/YHI9